MEPHVKKWRIHHVGEDKTLTAHDNMGYLSFFIKWVTHILKTLKYIMLIVIWICSANLL